MTEDGADAFTLTLDMMPDDALDERFAAHLGGVELGVHSSDVEVVLAPGRKGRFSVDLEEVARRLQGVYQGLDPFKTRNESEPYRQTSDGSRPTLNGETMANLLRTGEVPEWSTLGINEGVDLLFDMRGLGATTQNDRARFQHAWEIYDTTVSGPLRTRYDKSSGEITFLPPTLRFNIGKRFGGSGTGRVRNPAVSPQMKETIQDLSAQVQAAFPVAA